MRAITDGCVVCPACDGERRVEVGCSGCSGSGEGPADGTLCRSCKGAGAFEGPCTTCDGEGEIPAPDDDEELEESDGTLLTNCAAEGMAAPTLLSELTT